MLLVQGPPKALRDKGKIFGCSAEGVNSSGWGDQKRQHGAKHCRAPQKIGGVWRVRGGSKEVGSTWEGPEIKLYVQRLVQLKQEENNSSEERAGKVG